MKLNISNILTIARIIVIPIIVLCIYLKDPFYGWIAFVLFCLASITDYFDGYIARIRNEVTNFGTFLDPIADKLLVAAVILILTSKEVIADWETIPALIILLREIAVSGLREYLAKIKVSVPVSRIAKIKTSIQLIALAFLILSESVINIVPIIIIGSGPAGITIARKLEEKKISSLIVEAGDYEYNEDSQAYYKSKVIGDSITDLRDSRLRQLGGTSGLWGGWCKPIEKWNIKKV